MPAPLVQSPRDSIRPDIGISVKQSRCPNARETDSLPFVNRKIVVKLVSGALPLRPQDLTLSRRLIVYHGAAVTAP
jgi:hypothetical protein